MTYNWTLFNLDDALAGTLVGFAVTGKAYDLSYTGTLTRKGAAYEVKFAGYTLKVQYDGKVTEVAPANASWLNQTLQMVTTTMGDTGAVGGNITRSSGSSGTGYNDVAVLTNIEPRDQFAVNVLNAMLIHADHPESFNDARCLMYSRAAYRWAQAMMIAAADSREGQSTTPSQAVDINSGDLQSNTEKLLFNMSEYLRTGVVVTGTPSGSPVKTTVDGLDTIADSFYVYQADSAITIKISVLNDNQLHFNFQSHMAYSNLSIHMTLAVKEMQNGTEVSSTRTVGVILPKGTTAQTVALDDAVTEITSITAYSVRGKASNDLNTYFLSPIAIS